MQLDLEVQEINALLTWMGETPLKLGLYPLAMKIKTQTEMQLNAPPPPPPETPAEPPAANT